MDWGGGDSALSFTGNVGIGQEGKGWRGAPRQGKQGVSSAGCDGNLEEFEVAREGNFSAQLPAHLLPHHSREQIGAGTYPKSHTVSDVDPESSDSSACPCVST